MHRFKTFIIAMFASALGLAQGSEMPTPPSLSGYSVEIILQPSHNYYYTFNCFSLGQGGMNYIGLLNDQGYLIWFKESPTPIMDFKFHEGQSSFSYQEMGSTFVYKDLDTNFTLIDSLDYPPGFTTDAHEYLILPNGNKVILAFRDTIMDLSAYFFGASQGGTADTVLANAILEFDPAGTLINTWVSTDYVHPSETIDGYGYDPNEFDYFHANAIEIDWDGHYLISARHTNAVYKIHRTNGNVIWRLGGENSDFTFPNSQPFAGQHDIRRRDNGRYSLYDNGNFNGPPFESRANEYTLDTSTWTATLDWSYTHSPVVFGPAMGSFQKTTQDDLLINWGLVYRPEPTFTLIDTNQNVLLNMSLEDSSMSYRASAFVPNFTIQQPIISCQDSAGFVVLTAPAASDYLWNTGESTQSIVISDTGTYMVWIPQGEGMIGSAPLYIDVNGCPSIGVDAEDPSQFRLYPNPASDVLYVSNLTAQEELMLYTTDGRLIQKIVVNQGSATVDVSNLSSGTYILMHCQSGSLFVKQ